jgi:hypothetical protein
MRTQRALYSEKATVYTCEMDRCLHCNEPLQTSYTSGFKTVQTMDEVLKIAQRMKRCINPGCGDAPVVWGSAQWGQIAPVSCTYGYDVIAQIGWLRQTMRQPFGEIHADLARRVRISESQVRALYHYRYLPLLACYEQQQLERLKAVAERVGLLLTLDGLAPEGGEPQLWLVRELLSGITLRCGWMSRQDQAAFVNFLQPIADLGLGVAAVMSDKQRGLVPAVAKVFPGVPQAFCQAHYLDNAADPVAKADEAMKLSLRQGVRQEIGELIRQEKVEAEGVLTVTGVLPSPVKPQPSASQAASPQGIDQERDLIVQDLRRRMRYLLTLKGRPPFRLAGIEMFERLTEVKNCLERLIAHQATPQLLELQLGLQTALQTAQADYTDLRQAANWLEHIADLLDPEGCPARSGDQVRQNLFAYLETIKPTRQSNARLRRFFRTIQRTTHSYAPGLFHCYDVSGLPRTNNDRESDFRDLNRRLLRTTGQKGLVRRIIQREGAWELLPHPDTLPETIQAVSHVTTCDFQKERQRIQQHRNRFRLHTRSARQSQAQLIRLEQRWTAIPANSS